MFTLQTMQNLNCKYGVGFCEHWWIADLINDVSTVAYGFNGIQNHGTACAKSTKIKYALKIVWFFYLSGNINSIILNS